MNNTAAPTRNTRCHRCGGLLVLRMRESALYRVEASQVDWDWIPRDPTSFLQRLRGQWARLPNDMREEFCSRCGEHSFATTPAAASQRPPSSYEDPEGRINIPCLVAAAAFWVYGFKGNPLEMRLHDLSWSG